MNFFKHLEQLKPDKIFGLVKQFQNDIRSHKFSAVIGAYRSETLKPYLFESVRAAEQEILEKDKEYLPIQGDAEYITEVENLLFGTRGEVCGVQTVGGTGALRLCAEFLKRSGFTTLYVSNPTWANHQRIFSVAGLEVKEYAHNNPQFEQIEPGSLLLMQPSCHNPTGQDLSLEGWKEVCRIAKERSLFVIFDIAYQGFGEGLEEDVAPIRLFLQEGVEFAVAASQSKNFGLYAERIGGLFVRCRNHDVVLSHLKELIRGLYSNPPCHGARVVANILKNPEKRALWERELEQIRQRIGEMRALLADALGLEFIKEQKGMFSYIGLEKEVVQKLKHDYGIYLPDDGRINVAGLNRAAVHRLAEAILACEKKKL